MSKRVCVIGAGIAGISSARYLKEEGINFTVFEATRYLGGTWRYDPRVGIDENGLPIHTSMYKRLRTNLPKPTMELGGYPLSESLPSFPSWEDYYQYLLDYAKHYDIEKYIKFLHKVILVRRKDDTWKVKYENVITKEVFEEEFDFVIVGNGHFSKPRMPKIPGENLFKGTIIHSHDFRVTDPYRDRRVLVVGAGPSGMDIGLHVADVSKTLMHSQHSKVKFRTPFPPHYIEKPDIKEFNETGAIFVDGCFEQVDDVIYCTGFEYDYGFLDESCGLTIKTDVLYPLHQYMVNIRQPTMIIMGLVVRACLVIALDAQARYSTALVKGDFKLPSEGEMMQIWEKRMEEISAKNLRPSFIHVLAAKEDEYYEGLSIESGIVRVPPVMYKIRAMDTEAKLENLYTFRDYEYIIIDDHNFTRRKEQRTFNQSTLVS
ncbi:unnamed protein product [Arctia plantaginis]|uniref:Flavin-containing monooxygenase n=1 Tax=Arctia plantaginis TaxID=874455 RepID=A0A8S1ALJ2_ARCPL|nr:unnamed protein product [Arctia plantaginis]